MPALKDSASPLRQDGFVTMLRSPAIRSIRRIDCCRDPTMTVTLSPFVDFASRTARNKRFPSRRQRISCFARPSRVEPPAAKITVCKPRIMVVDYGAGRGHSQLLDASALGMFGAMNPLKLFCCSLLALTMVACGGPDRGPEQVAEAFWLAVLSQDLEGVRGNSTEESAAEVDLSMLDFSTTVTFGETERGDQVATVSTQLQDPSGEDPPIAVETLLAMEDGEWRVDAVGTLEQARDGLSSNLATDLRELSEEIQKELEAAVQELRKEMPELRQELQELGQVAEELRQSLNEQVPVIQEEVDALLRALQEIIEKSAAEPQPNDDEPKED